VVLLSKAIKIQIKVKEKQPTEPSVKKVTKYGVKMKISTPFSNECFKTDAEFISSEGAVMYAHTKLICNPAFKFIVTKKYIDLLLHDDFRLINTLSLAEFTSKYISQFVYSKEVEVEES